MEKKVLILLSNNEANDPFLYSQLLNIYAEIHEFTDKFIFCKGKSIYLNREFKQIDTNSKYYYFNYIKVLFSLIKANRKNVLLIHVRGFISACIFFLVSLLLRQRISYIYDPRGAFLIEKQESKSFFSYFYIFLHIFERYFIKNSLVTIVTSEKFKELYIKIYGFSKKYIVCYNVTTIEPIDTIPNLKIKNDINICYVGSINYWHDIDEIVRVFKYLSNIIIQKNVLNYVFTQEKNHALIYEKFKEQGMNVIVDFVHYSNLENRMKDMDIGISVVRPTTSTSIASPIKIADYIALNKIIVLNTGIGDFDEYFSINKSAILYNFQDTFTYTYENLINVNPNKNKILLHQLHIKENIFKLKTIINTLHK